MLVQDKPPSVQDRSRIITRSWTSHKALLSKEKWHEKTGLVQVVHDAGDKSFEIGEGKSDMPQLRSQRVKKKIVFAPIVDIVDQTPAISSQVVVQPEIASVQDKLSDPGPILDRTLDQNLSASQIGEVVDTQPALAARDADPLSAPEIGELVGTWPETFQDAYLRMALDLTCGGMPALTADRIAFAEVKASMTA